MASRTGHIGLRSCAGAADVRGRARVGGASQYFIATKIPGQLLLLRF